MIYFDNAATTRQKPQEVCDAVCAALQSFGGVGRGVHEASLSAGMTVYEAREELAALLGAPSAACVSFSHNATEALNIALSGLVHPGAQVIATAAAHNSVLRPLYRLQQERGIRLDIVPVLPDGTLDWDAYEQLLGPDTALVVASHSSNLTGDVYDVAAMAELAHAHGALLVVDAAQTAGVIDLDMQAQGMDVVCFTGHKSLYGPQGTGGLAVMPQVTIPPYNVGGSGTHTYDHTHPTAMPESLEAGTLNAHGIAGLLAGVRFVRELGTDAIARHEQALVARLEAGLRSVPGVRTLGGGTACRTGVVAFTVEDRNSGEISDILQQNFDICTRAGAHCAPLMHEALGTRSQGATRMSFSWFNTVEEVDTAIEAVRQIVEGGRQ